MFDNKLLLNKVRKMASDTFSLNWIKSYFENKINLVKIKNLMRAVSALPAYHRSQTHQRNGEEDS